MPYLGFPTGHDVHGDGSKVIALAAGHTAGSMIVFVTLPSGKRLAFIGELTWHLDDLIQIVPAHDLGAYDRIHRPTPATQPR